MSDEIEDLGKPREPTAGECCGSGCARCVWDVYFDNLAAWEAKRNHSNMSSPNHRTAAVQATRSSSPSVTSSAPTSSVGSVVVKYTDSLDADDDYGLPCSPDRDAPNWRSGVPYVEIADVGRVPVGETETEGDVSISQQSRLRILEVTLAAALPSAASFRPGDVVEVFVPNDRCTVLRLCSCLKLPPTRCCQLKASPFVTLEAFPKWLPQRRNVTVEDLLTHYIDLTSSACVRQPMLRLFEKYARADATKATLQELQTHPATLRQCIQHSFPSVPDVLQTFPDVTDIPLARLLEVAAPLRPRKFSIVDLSTCSNKVMLCVRDITAKRLPSPLVSESVIANAPNFRGHVTHALSNILEKKCTNESNKSRPVAWCRGLVGVSRIPASALTRPLVLIGGGSGVAPLLAVLLWHRRAALEASTAPVADTHAKRLFFGCRTVEEFTQISHTLLSPSLTGVHVAVSRERPETQSSALCVTFDHGRIGAVLSHHADDIAATVFQRGGAIITCGPRDFVQSTRSALTDILFPLQDDDDTSVQEQQFAMLEGRQGFVAEDWSNQV